MALDFVLHLLILIFIAFAGYHYMTTRASRSVQPEKSSSPMSYSCVWTRSTNMIKFMFEVVCWTIPLLVLDAIRLVCFVFCLFPGFVRFTWYYFVSARRLSRKYGSSCRQALDVYLAKDSLAPSDLPAMQQHDQAPVLIFFTGGAWIIGYKMWGALLARVLTSMGIIVVIPDLRNYPWGDVPSMVEDIDTSIQWVVDNIQDFGGDPDNIILSGQSAGGHLCLMALLRKATAAQREEGCTEPAYERLSTTDYQLVQGEESDSASWDSAKMRGFISVSAPYDLESMEKSFSRHGLGSSLIDRVFGGQKDEFDPYIVLSQSSADTHRSFSRRFPPMIVLHGTEDRTAPHQSASHFARLLEQVTTRAVKVKLYEGWSHTDPILEGPMDADQRFHRDMFDAVVEWTNSTTMLEWTSDDPLVTDALCPRILIKVGRYCIPF